MTKKKPPMSAIAQPIRMDMRNGTYEGRELQRNPGIPASRFVGFDLPSIRGGYRIWPDGR
jgi:hypothetical protein